jgi:hypothetical protein
MEGGRGKVNGKENENSTTHSGGGDRKENERQACDGF